MAVHRRSESETQASRIAPARTPDELEHRLINLAAELAEKQLRDGTASAQVISGLLKLGSSRERLEQQRLEHENELTKAKIDNLKSMEDAEKRYSEALAAMSQYTGQEPPPEDYRD